MVKAGIIAALAALVLAIGGSLFIPICVPCIVIFVGAVAGYLACNFEPAPDNGGAAKSGAIAGAIGGVGALLGQAIGSVINSFSIDPAASMDILRQFGFEMPSDLVITDEIFWISAIGTGCCIGVFDLLLMAGLGAVGGILWWQIAGKNR